MGGLGWNPAGAALKYFKESRARGGMLIYEGGKRKSAGGITEEQGGWTRNKERQNLRTNFNSGYERAGQVTCLQMGTGAAR